MKFKSFFNNVFKGIRKPKEASPTLDQQPSVKISQTEKQTTMSMFNYGVGGNEVKVDANEAINEIQHNKTMIIAQLTANDPVQPEAVTGLKTVEDVFSYFRPSIEVEMQAADGQTSNEALRFSNLGDFTPKNIISQSDFLNNLNVQHAQYMKIMKQLKTNKVLKNMVENEETRAALIAAIREAAAELQNNN